MPRYRRARAEGGTYFFTVVTHGRRSLFDMDLAREWLHNAFEATRRKQPFEILALSLLPDHIHTIWELPDGDADFSGRWRRIKLSFTHWYRSASGDRSRFWQERFWEHMIRNDEDLSRHVDYIHYNPVKHGLVENASDWPWSTYHRYVDEGLYAPGWGDSGDVIADINTRAE
jgi:putative transposase